MVGTLTTIDPDVDDSHTYSLVGDKFTQTFAYRMGGTPLSPSEEINLAKNDIIITGQSRYDDIGGDSWGILQTINPDIEILLAQSARSSYADRHHYNLIYLSDISRWNDSRGHSMGCLNPDDPENPKVVLLDKNGNYAHLPTRQGSGLYSRVHLSKLISGPRPGSSGIVRISL